jgi:hypothetical protein
MLPAHEGGPLDSRENTNKGYLLSLRESEVDRDVQLPCKRRDSFHEPAASAADAVRANVVATRGR